MKKFSFLLLLLPLCTFAAEDIHTFDNAKQEADYRALIQELRCPQCQNNNIADSNATISTDMREKTLELLKQGKTKQEVIDYMIERYGNFVSYDPPLTPMTFLLWLTPLLLIGGGVWLLFKRQRKGKQAVNSSQKSAKEIDQSRLSHILTKEDE